MHALESLGEIRWQAPVRCEIKSSNPAAQLRRAPYVSCYTESQRVSTTDQGGLPGPLGTGGLSHTSWQRSGT